MSEQKVRLQWAARTIAPVQSNAVRVVRTMDEQRTVALHDVMTRQSNGFPIRAADVNGPFTNEVHMPLAPQSIHTQRQHHINRTQKLASIASGKHSRVLLRALPHNYWLETRWLLMEMQAESCARITVRCLLENVHIKKLYLEREEARH